MKKNEELERVNFLISWWLTTIKSNNAIGFLDINKAAEGVVLKLLNEIFNYQLENLNYEKNNYPGIDLGDKINKIGFQITSRRDARKIKQSLEKFFKGPNEIYSNGIQFLILNQEKKPKLSSKKNKEICFNFDSEKNILNANDLLKEISQIYELDREKFYRIKEILEVEIANKSMRRENLNLLRSKLFEGSKRYYEALTGPNGRFKHLKISDIILSHPNSEWIYQKVSLEGEKESLENIMEVIPILWKKKCVHTVILGEGGMGKTVSLIRLWKEYLKKQDSKSPVPIFIALNEYNQISDASNRENFIISMIKKNYGDGTLTNEEIWEIVKTPQKKRGTFIPTLILLLDGFNEITLDKRELLIEMRHLIEQAIGVQIIITSRYDMRRNFNWFEFQLLKLMKLKDCQVDMYLKTYCKLSSDFNKINFRLRQLIRNPMMLTLYAATCEIQENHLYDENCDFKERVETPGELLWNFIETQIALLMERLGDDFNKHWLYKFLLKILIPAIGYEMEKAGQFEINRKRMNKIISKYFFRFSKEDFFLTFPEYAQHIDFFDVSRNSLLIKKREKLLKILNEELFLILNMGNLFRFLHQNFRDFFASIHIINEILISVENKKISNALKEGVFSISVRRYIGEIEGEHYCKPFFKKDVGWELKENKKTRLVEIIDLCRGIFDSSVTNVVWNIIEIWKDCRGELSGIDLSQLDLSKLSLNGVICNRFYKDKYLRACFDKALLKENIFYPQGHCNFVNSAIYSHNGKKIFSTSNDKTIKMWDIENFRCLNTFTGHSNSVNNIVFMQGNKGDLIFSTSDDNTIKEWNIETGECIKIFKGHTNRVNSIFLSPNGKKILTASDDYTIKEWNIETGYCIRTFKGHKKEVKTAIYRPDGEKILSSSFDKSVREWDIETGECKIILGDYDYAVNCAIYAPDCKKIFFVSREEISKEINTINKYDIKNGKLLMSLKEHTGWINSLNISPDGKKLLSASDDKTIKEWDIETGKCLKSFSGHLEYVNSAIYSSDGKKILSASNDKTIKEWDIETGECLRTFPGYDVEIIDKKSESQNGRTIITDSADNSIKEWKKIDPVKCLKTFIGHSNKINTVEFSSDKKKILSASEDHTIKEWDFESGKCLKTYEGHTNVVTCAIYGQDDTTILSTSWDKTIKKWDIESGMCLKTYKGHTDVVTCVKYHPNGKTILSTSWDKTIKEWDIDTGKCLRTFCVDSSGIEKAQYIDDGERIISYYRDGTNIEWTRKTGERTDTSQGESNLKSTEVAFDEVNFKSRSNTSIPNIPGIFIQGCSFKNLNFNSSLTEEWKTIIRKNGGEFD